MDVDTVADELYGLRPEEFTAARNEHAKRARSSGERELADQIRRLRKPTAAAWLVNQLVRERRDEIGPLLELGAALREATTRLHGEQLRRLSRQEHEIVYALVQQARAIASATGQRVTEDTARAIEQTLRAALADPDAAAQLATGRLSDALAHVGFAGTEQPSTPRRVASQRSDGERGTKAGEKQDVGRAERLEQAQRDVDEARAQVDQARAELGRVAAELDQAAEQERRLDAEMRRLREHLDAVVREHSRAERDERRARGSRDRADMAVREAERRLRDATTRHERLAGGR